MNEGPSAAHPDVIAAFRSTLGTLRLGPVQNQGPISIFPLHLPAEAGPDYLGLDEATASGRFRVTEVSPEGSVPQLWAANDCDRPVLLLDGEELAGAKQNRALNATALLPAGFAGKIPVSCTEQGRWRHTSAQFSSSEVLMEMKTRRRKASSVSESLAASATYHSDQGQVWDSISALQAKAGLRSPTSAMQDVFQAKAARMAEAMAAFPVQPQQHGLLVFLSGRPAGLDVVSRSRVYAGIHAKLVRSYILDVLLQPGNSTEPPTPEAGATFLGRIGEGGFRSHPGVGLGESMRTGGKGPVGGALLCGTHLIHAAFFAEGAAGHEPVVPGGMQSLRSRSRHAGEGGPIAE